MNVHTPSPQKILITPIGVSKTIFNMSLILTQNETNTTKSKYFNPYQIISHMQQLTHTQTENPSKDLHGNQQNIYYINIQRQEIDKGGAHSKHPKR